MKATRPLKLRQLQAAMKLKDLTLKTVAAKARINLSVACSVLSGQRDDPLKLKKLSAEIERAAMPTEPLTLENAQ